MRSKANPIPIAMFFLIAEIEAVLAQIERLHPMSFPNISRVGRGGYR